MIGKVLKGRGFRGVLDYVTGREGARLIGGNMEGRTARELAREFGAVRALRPTLHQAVRHIPLRLPPEERLSDAQWRRVAERLLTGLGYTHAPYVLCLHPHDPDGEHLHIVACAVDTLGRAVDDSWDVTRLQALERRIEVDYGLRQVPVVRNDLRRPTLAEHRVAEDTGRPSERQQLQRLLASAARPGRTVSEFLALLEPQGVQITPRILASGRVTGISYQRGDYQFSGSGLGAAFTWPGLQQKLHLDFAPERDLPALFAAAPPAGGAPAAAADPQEATADTDSTDLVDPAGPAGFVDPTGPDTHDEPAPPPAAQTPSAAPPGTPPPAHRPTQRQRTADQVAQQLAALGCPRYDVLVLDAATGGQRHMRTAWTPEQVQAALAWLQHENAEQGEILVRPAASAGLTLLPSVTAERLAKAAAEGYEPACSVRAADATREIWLRGPAEVPPAVQRLVDERLAIVFAAIRPARVPDWGHLAGFTSPLAKSTQRLARPPFLNLEQAAGKRYRRAAALVRDCRDEFARQDLVRRANVDIQSLGDLAASSPAQRAATPNVAAMHRIREAADREAQRLGLDNPHEESVRAAAARLERLATARDDLRQARLAAKPSGPSDAASTARRDDNIVAAQRQVESFERQLARDLGLREIPPDLSAEAAQDLARWRSVLDQAETTLDRLETDPEAHPTERYEAAVTVRTLREELADAVQKHGLTPETTSPPLDAPPPPTVVAEARPEPPDDDLLAAYDATKTAPAAASSEAAAGPWAARLAAEAALDEREGALRANLHAAIRAYEHASLDLDALEPKLLGEPSTERATAYDALVGRLATLEAGQLSLESRLLRLADHRLERDLARLRLLLAEAPSERLLGRHVEALEERRIVRDRLGDAVSTTASAAPETGSPPQAPVPASTAPKPPRAAAPDHAELQEAANTLLTARAQLLQKPSTVTVRAYEAALLAQRGLALRHDAFTAAHELRATRKEARSAADRLLNASPEVSLADAGAHLHRARWRRALLRHQSAEAHLAARLDATEPPDPRLGIQLAQLRRRLLAGDMSPDTLARVQRLIAYHGLAEGRPAAPPPRPPAHQDLAEALAAWRHARADLRAVARQIPDSPGAAQLDPLAEAVSRVQSTGADVDRLTFQPPRRLPGAPETSLPATLPPRYFLDRDVFARQPHRAAACWSAHAAGSGVDPVRIAQQLPRSRQSFLAVPRSLSSRYSLLLASLVTQLGRALWQHYTQEP